MSRIAIFAALPIVTVVLEIALGIAFLGWIGSSGSLVVEREKSPTAYWFVIALHLVIAIGLPILAWNSPLFGPR